MREIGVNTWVWTSPLTDAGAADLLRRIADMGFDAVELPLENAGDLTVPVVSDVLAETGLTPCVVGAMAPGRDLVDPSCVADTQDYLRACIDFAAGIGARSVCGPFYASTGRVWRMDADQRQTAYDDLRTHLAPVVDHAVAQGVRLGIEPLNRYETSLINTVDQALDRPRAAARRGTRPGPGQLPPQHRGALQRGRDPDRRSAPGARPGLRQRPWRAGRRPDRLEGPGVRPRRRRLRRPPRHRELHRRQRLHRHGRLHLASAGTHPGRARPRRLVLPPVPRLSDRPRKSGEARDQHTQRIGRRRVPGSRRHRIRLHGQGALPRVAQRRGPAPRRSRRTPAGAGRS